MTNLFLLLFSLSVFTSIPSPAGAGAAEPFVSTARDGVLLSWLEPAGAEGRFALRFARLRDGRWSAPVTIAEREDFFVNWADFPSIVEDERGVLFAHWLQKSGAKSYDYDIRMATSADGGRTWSGSFLLNRDGKQAEHGFVALAPLSGGGVAATWLDGRNMTAGDHGHGSGDMTLRYAEVTAGGKIRSERELDSRVCECCTTDMAMTRNGPIVVYRDRSAEEIRDISFVRAAGKEWTAPRPLRRDGWKIAACPVNGPQIASAGSRLAAAWFTAADEEQRVYVAFSSDGGKTFGDAIIVDEGKPAGRVDVVLVDNDAVVVWLEQRASGAEIRLRRVHPDGSKHDSVKVADSSMARGSGFPRMALSGRDLYIAWTEWSSTTRRIHVARTSF